MAEIVANFELNNNEISADMELSNDNNIDADFVIYSTGTPWGNISGDITNQTDLNNVLTELTQTVTNNNTAINNRVDDIDTDIDNLNISIQNEATARASKDSSLDNDISTINGKINNIEDTLDGLGDIVTHNVNEFATASQGQLAETSLQSGDNISELVNDSGYITNNALSGYATESWVIGQGYTTNEGTVTSVNNVLPDSNGNVTIVLPDTQVQADWNESNTTSKAYIKNKPTIPSTANDVSALPDTTKYGKSIDITLNTTDYQLTISLKDQDGTVLNSKVVDFPLESVVVNGAYDSANKKVILTLQNGSTIEFSVADLISGLQTEITSTNKLDSDLVDDTNQTHKFVTASDKQNWNNKQDNIADLSTIRSGASAGATAVQPNDLSTVATSGSYNDLSGKPTIPTVPANVSAFTNDSGYITSSALSGYATESWVGQQGYITGIDDSDVTTALGYTPVNPSSLSTVATSGSYNDLINKPTIPTVNDATLTIMQGGDVKGTFSANASNNVIVNLDASSSLTVDNELSTTSTNPVQNKVITQALQNIDVDSLIPVTYAELVALKTNSQLKEGAFYRITDYVTTTNGRALYYNITCSSRSVGHQFDIIIQALGTSNLSDIGTCALHEGDTYFANSNLGSWQIWYDINNDTNKYQWADATNGKGVIYRMIDERFNDLPYDFKNIQFSRNVADYSELSEYLVASDNYYYTFSFIQNNEIVDNSVSGNVSMCNYNTVEYATAGSNNSRALNNIVIIGSATSQQCTSNYIGRGTWELTAVEYFYSNDIHGGSTYNNIFKMFYMNSCGNFFYNNKLICSTAHNILGSNFHDNTVSSGTFAYNNIDVNCYSNTMSGSITYNTIGSNFYSNTISSTNFTTNKIGDVVYSNTFTGGNTRKNFIVGDCYNNTFNTFYLNFIGYYFAGNNVGANFGYNTILDTSSGNTFGTGCQGNVLLGYDANISFPNNCRALVVGRFVVGSSTTNKLNLTGIPTGATYQITILRDVNNLPVAKWQDNNLEVGLYKTSLTASTWSNLITTLTLEDWDV